MADIKKTVTQTEDHGVDVTGTRVQQQTKRIQTESVDPKTTAQNGVWYVLGFIEILIGFRFVLKIFGANPANGFVEFIYNATGLLTVPFDTIFGVTRATAGETHSVFEPSILVAAVIYALIAWGIIKLITINQKSP